MRYRFANYELLPGRRELLRDGQPVALEPQTFDLILALVERREEVVSKQAVVDHVWQGRAIADATLNGRINAARTALGDDGRTQWAIRTVPRRGFRFVAEVTAEDNGVSAPKATDSADGRPPELPPGPPPSESVRFCRSPDGTRLAFAVTGQGPTLVKAAQWISHIQEDWNSPMWAHLMAFLSRGRCLVRHDARGNGLSDRDVDDISLDAWVADMEAVVEAAGIDRFSIFGMSQGAAVAAAYAARHPARVERMVLVGGYARGRLVMGDQASSDDAQAMRALLQHGWGEENTAYLRALGALYMPDATTEQARWFARMQRIATSAQMAVRIRAVCDRLDVVDILPQVRAKTLVIHARGDAIAPYEAGRLFATHIPDARFVALDSANHLPVAGDAAWQQAEAAIEDFLSDAE